MYIYVHIVYVHIWGYFIYNWIYHICYFMLLATYWDAALSITSVNSTVFKLTSWKMDKSIYQNNIIPTTLHQITSWFSPHQQGPNDFGHSPKEISDSSSSFCARNTEKRFFFRTWRATGLKKTPNYVGHCRAICSCMS